MKLSRITLFTHPHTQHSDHKDGDAILTNQNHELL